MTQPHSEGPKPALLGDIGGTHARFALLEPGKIMPTWNRVIPTREHPTPDSAIERYLSMIGGDRPDNAALAVAGPVKGDAAELTNHPWRFPNTLRHGLKLDRLLLINDFRALALAVPKLRQDDVRQVGGGRAAADTPKAVIGPGTGLGVATAVPLNQTWLAIEGEGGHVTYSACTRVEDELLLTLRKRYGHVSGERVVSGPGLVNLHDALRAQSGLPAAPVTPPQVLQQAQDGCALCAKAVAHFCAMLGTLSGNLALTVGARGGVYIGGGIVPRLGPAFDRSPFRERFLDHGRFRGYLEAVPTFVITTDDAGLLGAAQHFIQTMDQVAL